MQRNSTWIHQEIIVTLFRWNSGLPPSRKISKRQCWTTASDWKPTRKWQAIYSVTHWWLLSLQTTRRISWRRNWTVTWGHMWEYGIYDYTIFLSPFDDIKLADYSNCRSNFNTCHIKCKPNEGLLLNSQLSRKQWKTIASEAICPLPSRKQKLITRIGKYVRLTDRGLVPGQISKLWLWAHVQPSRKVWNLPSKWASLWVNQLQNLPFRPH